jgi:hypothetical protein
MWPVLFHLWDEAVEQHANVDSTGQTWAWQQESRQVLNQASTESEHWRRSFHLVAYRSHRRLPVNGTTGNRTNPVLCTNFHIWHLMTRSGHETRRPKSPNWTFSVLFAFGLLNRPLDFNETLVQPVDTRLPLDVSSGRRHLSSRTRRDTDPSRPASQGENYGPLHQLLPAKSNYRGRSPILFNWWERIICFDSCFRNLAILCLT